MAFTNLFTSLAGVTGSCSQPSFPRSNDTNNNKWSRKRKNQSEPTGAPKKKHCYQAHPNRTHNPPVDGSNDVHPSVGFTKDKSDHNNMPHRYQNYQNNWGANKQQGQRMPKQGKRNHWKNKAGGGNQQMRNHGGGSRNTNNKKDFQKKQRFMTPEFMDQNVVSVDGRFLCRHFLFGRCIKGDDCQLEHVQGYNDMVKELCKFYVQGFCTKGESCAYMHNSFPCKFFHSKGKCSEGANCRFSHETLNDVTSRLLEEALKREKEHFELAKKAEQPEPAENTEEEQISEVNGTSDLFLQPIRTSFYNSSGAQAETVASVCAPEEQPDVAQEAVPLQNIPSPNHNPPEPVCYSVEAVLGPQLSKPFSATPRSQELVPLPCFDSTADPNRVPYSVSAVLRSFKSIENSTISRQTSPPTAQTVSSTPKPSMEEVSDHTLETGTQNKEVFYSVNFLHEGNKSQEKMFMSPPSPPFHTSSSSKTSSSNPARSGDHSKQGRTEPESVEPARRTSRETNMDAVPTSIKGSANCKKEGGHHFRPANHISIIASPLRQTFTPRHPKQQKPHLPVLTPGSQAPSKPFSRSTGFTEFKAGTAALVEPVTSPVKSSDPPNSLTSYFSAKPPSESLRRSNETKSGLGSPGSNHSTEATAESSRDMARRGDPVVGRKNTLNRPFNSLFANSIPLTQHSAAIPAPQVSPKSSCPASQSRDGLRTALEPSKTPGRPFFSLFGAPLSAPEPGFSTSSSQQSAQSSVGDTPHLSKQRTSHLEPPLLHRVGLKEIYKAPTSLEKDSSAERRARPLEQLVDPTDTLSPKERPDISTHKGPAANSVLKTLFLSLSPYKQGGEQQDRNQVSGPSESVKKGEGDADCASVTQRSKTEKEKKRETQDSHPETTERRAPLCREQQPSLLTPEVPLEAKGASALSRPGKSEPLVENRNLLLMQPDTQSRRSQEEGKRVKNNVAATPLTDLFKTLGTGVFH